MMKLKYTSRRHRIVIGIIIVITIVISAFLFELLRACLYYGAGWGPKATKIQGIEYYSNGEYLNFHEGKYAAENLPSLEEVNSAVYADFYYSDYTTRETLFGNGAVGFAVGVRYDEKEYCEKGKTFYPLARHPLSMFCRVAPMLSYCPKTSSVLQNTNITS